MAMGYGANTAEVITLEDVKKLELEAFRLLEATLQDLGISWDDFGEMVAFDSVLHDKDDNIISKDIEKELIDLLGAFYKEFQKETGIGIELCFHNKENNGDRYDEVEGAFFGLNFGDVYTLSPEAKKLKERLFFDTKYFVNYG